MVRSPTPTGIASRKNRRRKRALTNGLQTIIRNDRRPEIRGLAMTERTRTKLAHRIAEYAAANANDSRAQVAAGMLTAGVDHVRVVSASLRRQRQLEPPT